MLSVVLVLCHLCLSSVFVIFVCSVQSLSALIFSRFRRALLAAYYYPLLASSLSSIFACSLASLSSLLFLFVIFVLRSLSSFVIFVCYLRLLSSFVIFVPCLRSLLSFDIFFCYLRSLLSFVIFARYLRLLPSFVIFVIFHSTRSSSSSFVACLVRHLSRLSFCSVLCVSWVVLILCHLPLSSSFRAFVRYQRRSIVVFAEHKVNSNDTRRAYRTSRYRGRK
jgi:hypothetical protein